MIVVCLSEGDAVGIYPENCAEEVDEILQLTGWTASEFVDVPDHAYQPFCGNVCDIMLLSIYSI